jgi:hypothetical protein
MLKPFDMVLKNLKPFKTLHENRPRTWFRFPGFWAVTNTEAEPQQAYTPTKLHPNGPRQRRSAANPTTSQHASARGVEQVGGFVEVYVQILECLEHLGVLKPVLPVPVEVGARAGHERTAIVDCLHVRQVSRPACMPGSGRRV